MPIFHQPHNSVGNHTYNVVIYDTIDYGLHFHKNYEFIYVMKGEAVCTINNNSRTLMEGEFALCLSNEIHAIRSVGESKVWIGVFSDDFIPDFKKHLCGNTGSEFSFRCSAVMMRFLCENLLFENPSDIFMIKSCLYALCSEYLKQISLSGKSDRHMEIMNRSVDYIEKNYNRTVTLAELAQEMGYEYCYFSKIFGRIFSMSFNQYLNTYRFHKACELLTDTDLSITQVAFKSGFQSIRNFNDTFKKLAAVSPCEYRKMIPRAYRTVF